MTNPTSSVTDAEVEAALITFFRTPVFASGHELAMRRALEQFLRSRSQPSTEAVELPPSYKSGTVVSSSPDYATVTLHFSDAVEAELWAEKLTPRAAHPPAAPTTGRACRWNGEVYESRCDLHEAWHVAIHDWAERAKAAEAQLKAAAPVGGQGAVVKRWPFVELPGEFTERLRTAMREFNGDLLAAVRNVLIENPAQIRQWTGEHDWRDSPSYGGELCASCGAVKGSARGMRPCAIATPSAGVGGGLGDDEVEGITPKMLEAHRKLSEFIRQHGNPNNAQADATDAPTFCKHGVPYRYACEMCHNYGA